MASFRLRRGLASQLLILTVGIALVSELLILGPWVARQRDDWLNDRITQGYLAALAAADGKLDQRARDDLLHIADVVSVRLIETGRPITDLDPLIGPIQPAALLDLRTETVTERAARIFETLFRTSDRMLVVVSPARTTPMAIVQVVVHEGELARDLRSFAFRAAMLTLAAIAVAGALVYLSLMRLLVLPMRRLTQSIASFRADPEHTALPGPTEVELARHDEIGDATRELTALQREMRTALWRNARLAALGTAVAKVSHDLRGTLAPALLAAERLESDPDPAVRQTGTVLMRAIDRTTEIFTRTLEFSRDTPFAPVRTRFALQPLMEEAAEVAGAAGLGLTVTMIGPINDEIEADRIQLLRVLANLLRNAGEAKARNATVEVIRRSGATSFVVSDDGPGLPANVQKDLFRPFVRGSRPDSTGLGLAIVRDLVLAQGGSILLERTGPDGTRFRLTLPDPSAMPQMPRPSIGRSPVWRQPELPDNVKQRLKRTV